MQELLVELKDDAETKGYQLVVDPTIEGGIIDPDVDPADRQHYIGTSLATQRSQVEVEKEQERQKQESWQPPQNWGSSSSSWWWEDAASSNQQDWWTGAPPAQDTWLQEKTTDDCTTTGVSANTKAWGSCQPPRDHDHRGAKIIKFWGCGAKQYSQK